MAEFFGIFRKKKEEATTADPDRNIDEEQDMVDAADSDSYKEISLDRTGKFIVIEGNDGSGKKTQVNMLADRLRNEGKEVETVDFPDYNSFYGKTIRKYLNGEYGKDVNPYLISMAYANDRLQKKAMLKRFLKEGKIVICNRYVASNKAHLAVKLNSTEEMQKFVKWVDDMEYEINRLPRPDLTIYLNVPSEIAYGMLQQRAQSSNTKTDIHEKLPYMQKVEQVYLAMSKNKNWMKIDCVKDEEMLTKGEVHGKVYNIIVNLI